MAKEMEYDVVVASMDAQMYVDFCAAFKMNHFPAIKWFAAEKDVLEPVDVAASTRGEIEKFIREQFEHDEL
ncbi:uncharacterized protein [Blastocystis hominis]|uniref:Thioredoxin domain-containing protein n=1 Tax=Blastocystis hominis TaxID=12968 RepID=D8LY67_BLAHO|nr:uncharacterized protein [Blastocystis hominis]CBK20522.2 unnamed protein product [Blastocystis hominis]|eukprot:XP_012894570.1 uncharacterized protein [Blastocystis hominis]